MMRLACLALVFVAAACSDQAPAPPEIERTAATGEAVETAEATPDEGFRYTRLTGCTLTRSAPEEAGFFEHECAGEGGYRLRHVEADLREDIVVLAPDGTEHSLELSALAGGAFSSTGDTVEWRGGSAAGTFSARALIVRHSVMEDPDPKVPEVSYLVVAKLAPRPCVVIRIAPGPDQNARARQAADRAGDCLDRSG